MPGLIKELKDEHSDIIELLMRVKALKVCSDDGQRVLINAKDLLIEHLKKEDEELYPALKQAAVKDSTLARHLDSLKKDMVGVSTHVFDFFEKYSADTADSYEPEAAPSFCERVKKFFVKDKDNNTPEKEFSRDFDNLYHILLDRVNKEESVLYAAFEKLSRQ